MKKKFNIQEEIEFRTRMQKYRFKETIDLANKFDKDPKVNERLKEQECIVCYYQTQIVLHAFTDSNCVNCDVKMTFSNSSTDKLCEDCAKQHNCCKHCGADINYEERNKL